MNKKRKKIGSIVLSTVIIGSYFYNFEPVIANAANLENSTELNLNSRATVSVSSIKLNKKSATLYPGFIDNTIKLTATIAPSNATVKTVKWSSNNTNIAKVDSKGNVTAVSPGSAKITAKSNNGKVATCTITVKSPSTNPDDYPKPTRAIYLTYPTMKGKDVKFVQAALKKLGYYKSDIDGSFGEGCKEATKKFQKANNMTADGSMGPATQKVLIAKLKEVPVTSIKLNKTILTIDGGKSAPLTATVAPSNATVKTVIWTSSNTKVATVDSKGVVKGVAAGKATITAKSNNGKTATCTVTVKEVPVTSIKLNKTSATLEKGKSITLTETVAPTNATVKTVTWTSSNTKIVTVDSKGVVKGVAAGKATITAKSNNGKTATCTVTVKNPTTNSESINKNLKVKNYKQYDSKWKNYLIGDGKGEGKPETIEWIGCTTTALAIVENYRTKNDNITPLFVAKKSKYDDRGCIIWPSTKNIAGLQYKKDKFISYNDIYKKIKAGKPVIIGVNSSGSDTSNHWVVIHGYENVKLNTNGNPTGLTASNFLISDPARSTVRTLAQLHNVAPKYSKNSEMLVN